MNPTLAGATTVALDPGPPMHLASVGDCIREGSYELHSRFRTVVNFTDGDVLVAVVSRAVGPGPLNLLVDPMDPERIDRLTVGDRSVAIGGGTFRRDASPVYDSRIPSRSFRLDALAGRLEVMQRVLLESSPPTGLAFLVDPARGEGFKAGFERAFRDRMRQGADLLFSGRLVDGVRMLKGCGIGLTPSGDDFLTGVLFGLHVLEVAGAELSATIDRIFEAAGSDSPFSRTMLALARKGRCFGKLKALLEALLFERPDGSHAHMEVTERSRDLFAVGASSGTDLGTGLLLTLGRGESPWS